MAELSDKEAAALGLDAPAGGELSDEEAKALGLADAAPAEPSTALEAGIVSALDSASMIGAPTVLAALDAFSDRPGVLAEGGTTADAPFGDKFRKMKDFYERGRAGLKAEHPVASTIGALAPALIPGGGGSGLGQLARQGAVYGGASGLLGGDADTLDGDILGTIKDTAVGTGLGALGGAGGALLGKGVSAIGKLAGGRSAQLGQEAAEAASKEFGELGTAVRPGAREAPAIGDQMSIFSVGNKTANLRPPPAPAGDTRGYEEVLKKVLGNQQGNADAALKRALTGAAGGAGGYYLGKKLGVPPEILGALGAVSGVGAGKQLLEALAKNPELLERISKVVPLGEFLSKLGSRLGSRAGDATADEL